MWSVLLWRDVLLQYFLVSITLGCEIFHYCVSFCFGGDIGSDNFTSAMRIFPQLWMVLDCKSALSYLDLLISHHGCGFFNTYEQLWIWSLHFRSWIWRFHTRGVRFFTTMNNSKLEVCIFVLGSEGFTPFMWIVSQPWTALDLKSAFSWLGLKITHFEICQFHASGNISIFLICR